MLNMEAIQSALHTAAMLYPIKRAELFGSYADGTASESSDIDLLVEFNESPVSLLKICGLQETLTEILKTNVDVVKLPLQESSDLIIRRKVSLLPRAISSKRT